KAGEGEKKTRNATKRRENTVQYQQGKRRSPCINSKAFEDACDQKWVKRWLPGCRPGRFIEWVSKALARSQRSPNPPHLIAKAKVVVNSFEIVGVRDEDHSQPQNQSDQYHPEERSACRMPPGMSCNPLAWLRSCYWCAIHRLVVPSIALD